MDQYEFIRTAFRVYGNNISQLRRMTGHSRNTIKKALRGESWGYKERQHQPFPVLGSYLGIIDEWLTSDKKHPKKQRHTARRIYNRLVVVKPGSDHDLHHGTNCRTSTFGCPASLSRFFRQIHARCGTFVVGC